MVREGLHTLHSFARIGVAITNMHTAYISIPHFKLRIIEHYEAISTLKPVRMLLEMSHDPKKRPTLDFTFRLSLYSFVHGTDVAILWVQKVHSYSYRDATPMWMNKKKMSCHITLWLNPKIHGCEPGIF